MWTLVLLACSSPTAPATVAPPTPKAAHWQVRSDTELNAALEQACKSSLADKRPVLVEFSAPWCMDCKALEQLEDAGLMDTAYAGWHRVRIDVGRFERHGHLREAFGVGAIAYWVALAPVDCSLDASAWPVLDKRSVEVHSNKTAGNPKALEDWLAAAAGKQPHKAN